MLMPLNGKCVIFFIDSGSMETIGREPEITVMHSGTIFAELTLNKNGLVMAFAASLIFDRNAFVDAQIHHKVKDIDFH